MNQFRDKLRSRAGASMMLALVFMLFCAFVGGSVLASATANAQRVGDLQEQQEFLLERSAALLLSDQLQLDSDQHLRLKVVDAQKSIQEVTITNGGGIVNQGDPTQAREITFTLQTNVGTLSPMQQLMVEAAVQRYLVQNCVGMSLSQIKFANFLNVTGQYVPFAPPATEEAAQQIAGTLNVEFQGNTIPAYEANFSCGDGEEQYSFFIDFGDLSQMKLTSTAYSGTSYLNGVVGAPVEREGKTVQITTNYSNTTISWSEPFIEKGGAA